jgi:acyl carrier protein
MEPNSDAEITGALRGIIASVADVPIEVVPASGPFFEPVGLDSMMVVAIAVEIQERFGVEPPRTAAEMLALNSIERMTRFIATALERGKGDEWV